MVHGAGTSIKQLKDAVNKWCDEKWNHNKDISEWDVTGVTDMKNLFKDKTNFNDDISKWDVSNVTNMSSTFNGASSFNQDIKGTQVMLLT